jgi:PIN domain nuclease of toxin-antitoxin system
MKYLIDTHILIWALTDSKKLSKSVRKILSDGANDVFVSMTSILEIAIKISVGKLELKGEISVGELERAIRGTGFDMIDITGGDCSVLAVLPHGKNHKDPFDRLLVSQAIDRGLRLISCDKRLNEYAPVGLKLICG